MRSKLLLSLPLVALAFAACANDNQPAEPGEGTLALPLLTVAPSGVAYRLVGATFVITGPQPVTVTDTSGDTVSVPLSPGAYSIQLVPGWTLEQADTPGVTVQATLVSPNPMTFVIKRGATTTVQFKFKLGGGAASVGITVDGGGWISGTFTVNTNLTTVNGVPFSHAFDTVVGVPISFSISYEFVGLTTNTSAEELDVTTGPTVIQFGGDPGSVLTSKFSSLDGTPIGFNLTKSMFGSTLELGFISLFEPTVSGPGEHFTFELGSAAFTGGVDGSGVPLPDPISIAAGSATLRRFNNGTFTDFATGPASFDVIIQ